MPNWTPMNGTLVAEQGTADTLELLQESMADLERLYREDAGWARIGQQDDVLTAEGRKSIVALCRISTRTNPLLKRGSGLRAAYVFGGGVDINVPDTGETDQQDVNGVVDQFWNDPGNLDTFTGSQAQENLERALFTDGEVFLALPTILTTGRVQVRKILPEEIDSIFTDPDDAARPIYYRRAWTSRGLDVETGRETVTNTVTYYPALGYWPATRPKNIGGKEVRWDAPMLHVRVNVPENSDRGLGDCFAALPWAKADKEVLEAWVLIYKALSRIAWRTSTRGDKAAQAAARVAQATAAAGNPTGAGATVGMDPNTTLEAVPKTGAIIDADGARPLIVMVAAALEVPVTMLTGDAGITGARAVAETLDQPTELTMSGRRKVWGSVIRKICGYVIDQAVISTGGPLRGTVTTDDNRRIVTLPEADDRQVNTDWPEYASTPVNVLMAALAQADTMQVLPPVEVLKLVCRYLQIDDVDDIIAEHTDADGNWIPLDVADNAARQTAAQQGGTNVDPNAQTDGNLDPNALPAE